MDKYIEMLRLSAQIEVLKDLPYTTVYDAGDKLNNLHQKSAVMMDDLIKVLNEKRSLLSKLNGDSEILRLRTLLAELEGKLK